MIIFLVVVIVTFVIVTLLVLNVMDEINVTCIFDSEWYRKIMSLFLITIYNDWKKYESFDGYLIRKVRQVQLDIFRNETSDNYCT